jgi:hypothetical protein
LRRRDEDAGRLSEFAESANNKGARLRKCVPDLAAAKSKSEQTHRYVIEAPKELSNEEWQRKYGSDGIEEPPPPMIESTFQ